MNKKASFELLFGGLVEFLQVESNEEKHFLAGLA